jgi:beta-1,4-mannosyl-glycoprotein beta-1,4-N-acetylglucosaminyltransferase
MKIIDCFIFYNEIDLLNYRLHILDHIVDYFIIVESKHTFIGKSKPLYFELNKSLFSNFLHKIIHIIVHDFPYQFPNIDFVKNQQWQNEIYQRNYIKIGLDKITILNEDIFLLTDVDEIPNPKILEDIKSQHIAITINALEMDCYYYNLNHLKLTKWLSGRIINYGIYKKVPISLNDIRMSNCKHVIRNGGWHLSYFGNSEFIQNKINNFSHQELNIPIYTDIDKINERLRENKDIFDRRDKNSSYIHLSIENNKNLPYKYQEYLTQFIPPKI